MQIKLNNIGKRYNYEWIFRNVNYEFTSDNNYVILGANGSGKSTLLQVIAGSLIASEGTIEYKTKDSELKTQDLIIPEDEIFKHISFASPYLELFDEFTLIESIEFQAQFKPFFDGLTTNQIIGLTQLEKAKDKQLKYYSSGMKQRVRLALAILCNTPLLLLDEPTSNLDKKSIDWYQNLADQYSKQRMIIVCSNEQTYEYPFCNKHLHIEDYKQTNAETKSI
jgi:ABC-type multidrug transport system ATPase subunit